MHTGIISTIRENEDEGVGPLVAVFQMVSRKPERRLQRDACSGAFIQGGVGPAFPDLLVAVVRGCDQSFTSAVSRMSADEAPAPIDQLPVGTA